MTFAGMALLAVGCAPVVRSADQVGLVHHVSAVPWVDRPAPVYAPPQEPKPTASYPPCRAWQLAGRPGRGGPAAGTVFQEVRLTNRSDRSCTLAGAPTGVTGVAIAGGATTLAAGARGANLEGPGPANIRPGQSGWITLSYADGCPELTSGGEADYRTLFIELDDGLVRVDFPAALNLVCGVAVSGFGGPPPAPPSTASPLNALTATVAAPATFGAGSTATFAITLANHTGSPVRLAPCPSYAEYLGVFSGTGKPANLVRRYYLNCAAVERIAANRVVTFVMRMPVPARAGSAKLDWQLQGTDVATAVVVRIRGRSR